MKKSFKSDRIGFIAFFGLFVFLGWLLAQAQNQQYQIEKAKIFQEAYPVISESDLYCSYFVLEDDPPDWRVIGAERQNEKILLSDDDIVYVNRGQRDGVEVGQLFMLVEVKNKLQDFGYLGCKRGRLRIISCEDSRSVGRIEKSCGQVTVGNFLFPFEEKEGLLGKDLGFEPYGTQGQGPVGRIIFLENDFVQVAAGHWAIINLGRQQGMEVGQQLTVFRRVSASSPREAVANAIVIDVSQRTATVKILSAKDAIFSGYEVQGK